MKAIILCAGYATRLYPLTLDKPKPLLEVKGRLMLDYIVKKIDEVEEVDEIYIVTNNKFYGQFVSWLDKNEKNFGKKIEIINDNTSTNETRLGGIGDEWFVKEKKGIDDDILVVLGDNLFDFDLREMVGLFNKIKKTIIGVFDVNNVEEAKKFGVVEVDGNKIISFEEKPANPKSTLISTGVYIYSKDDLTKIGQYIKSGKPMDKPGNLIEEFVSSQDVYAFLLSGRWFDIGSIETYKKVKEEW